jgi:hypothetical protein
VTAKPKEAASIALAGPHRDVGGFQGLVHDTGQVISDRVQVHRIFQPGRRRSREKASRAGSPAGAG